MTIWSLFQSLFLFLTSTLNRGSPKQYDLFVSSSMRDSQVRFLPVMTRRITTRTLSPRCASKRWTQDKFLVPPRPKKKTFRTLLNTFTSFRSIRLLTKRRLQSLAKPVVAGEGVAMGKPEPPPLTFCVPAVVAFWAIVVAGIPSCCRSTNSYLSRKVSGRRAVDSVFFNSNVRNSVEET